ncbi:MAG: 23S rRNA (adenine(2503)-C(2))-methyltransferase RlmN [Phycisphaerales bacterium]|nr:23S rRNA (adenine(2503)-C(2))-methyltransferase RlmN [Phycisphaerales bacterium]
MPAIPDSIPHPFCVNAQAYADACVRAGMHGGEPGALERYRALFRKGETNQPLLSVELPPVLKVHESESGEGTVRKFLLPLGPARPGIYAREDLSEAGPGATMTTETVIIPMIGKKRILTHTLCVSSQVGCAMGCGFCQTAQMGLLRNLTAEEIVAQWFVARHVLGVATITNVVFMGMGEPMDNLDEVIKAIAVLSDHSGPCLPMSKITISTVGRVDGIARLAEQVHQPGWHRLNLATSLNAPSDEIRASIMPINKRFPMAELRTALETWPIYGAAKLCLEYVMIPGVNDRPEHATQLADYVLGRGPYAGRPPLPGLVNLIPYNPREHSPWPAPDEASVDSFLALLTASGVYAKRRRTKGRDTMAACGQLGSLELRRKRPAPTGVPLSISARE